MSTRIVSVLGCVLALGFLPFVRSADDASPEPPADVTCVLNSGMGTLIASSGPGGLLLRVDGPTNSGMATFTFSRMTPPRLKFRIAGANARRTFTISDGTHSYTGQLTGTEGKSTRYYDRLGRIVADPSLAAVTLVLENTKAGDMDVTVSTVRGVELGKELKVRWRQNIVMKR